MLLLHGTCACSKKREFFLKRSSRSRHLFRILPYLVHCTSRERKVT